MSTITDTHDDTGDYDDHDPVAELHKHHTDMFYVRIAVVQPDEKIALVAQRLAGRA